ncbi:MAG: winged helix-turn-helix domain-containing protein [Thermoplasmata archaeon]|nr:winged helix-turn-helix domain-containing protein [Thermoplasmata archaeon]
MEKLLWYLLAGTRGGPSRIRIVDLLLEQPRNAHRVSEALGMDYRTVRHHLRVLCANHLVEQPRGRIYGAEYVVSGGLRMHLETFERIQNSVQVEHGTILANAHNPPRARRVSWTFSKA